MALDNKGSPAADAINKLGSYGINVNDVYSSSIACQAAHPNGDGSVDTSIVNTDGSIPACFYAIPVIPGTSQHLPCKQCNSLFSNPLIKAVCVGLCGCKDANIGGGLTGFQCPL
jgi:hypothetical protein